jgi:predicted cytidylate kinase
MVKKQIITINGRPGSGKSSAAKLVAQRLGYQHFSSGNMIRDIARQHGMDLLEASHAAEIGEINMDELVDNRLKEIGRTQNKLVIDSRLAWHWMKQSFKVYLDLDIATAAQRILAEKTARHNEKLPTDVAEYQKILAERYASENRRYRALYQVDPSQLENYDLVIDTKVNNQTQVSQIIIAAYRKWLGEDS